jgi:hypothetical protein
MVRREELLPIPIPPGDSPFCLLTKITLAEVKGIARNAD